MSAAKIKLRATIDSVASDKRLSENHREAALDMLSSAEVAMNGTPDKINAIADAVGHMAIYLARRDKHYAEEIAEGITKHIAACPINKGGLGKAGLLYLFRWPLTLAAFSPWVGPVLGDVIKAFVSP